MSRRLIATRCGMGSKQHGYYGLGNVPIGTAVDWRQSAKEHWTMSLGGTSDPVRVRLVGVVINISVSAQFTEITLRSLSRNGFALSRSLLQTLSVNSTGTHAERFSLLRFNLTTIHSFLCIRISQCLRWCSHLLHAWFSVDVGEYFRFFMVL